MSVLRLENVKKTFDGGCEVLRGVSLAVEEGEVVAVIGPSGGGKSTLLRCMIDLEEITGGSIYVGEEALVRDGKYCAKADRARLISEMGMVFQSFNLFPHMTVRENLMKPYLLTRPGAADAGEKCMALLEKVDVKGISHITGGGLYENIPRSIPDGLGAEIKKADVRTLPIFDLIAKAGDIPERDMYNTFNMGVGMSAVVAAEDAEKAVETLKANGVDAYILGKIIKSTDKVVLI